MTRGYNTSLEYLRGTKTIKIKRNTKGRKLKEECEEEENGTNKHETKRN
jgi:hypothetical protein